jgi:hypothetical protein
MEKLSNLFMVTKILSVRPVIEHREFQSLGTWTPGAIHLIISDPLPFWVLELFHESDDS